MRYKKVLALLLTLTITGSMLIGCKSKGGDSLDTKGGALTENEEMYTPNGTYPVLKEGEQVTISVFAPLRGSTTDFNSPTNLATKWLEEKSGVKFNFQTCLEVDARQKLNSIMVSGDLPEVLMFSGNYPMTQSELLLYGGQGDIIPLNDLIENYMPNLKKILDEKPRLKKVITMSDGNIYTLPQVGKASHTMHSQKLWINQTWLDNLKLEAPKTTEDLYNVLKAFKEKDANGNGDPNDEIPLSGSLTGWNTDPVVFIMNAFCNYYRTNYNTVGLYIDDDGKIVYPKTTKGWKEGLKYLNRLCSEGLLDSLTFSQKPQELKKLGDNTDVALVGACTAGSIAQLVTLSGSDRWKEYTTVEPLEGPTGIKQAVSEPDAGKAGVCITNKCKEPIAVARALDLFYEEEGVMWNKIGAPEKDYVKAGPDDKNYIGEPAKYIRLTASSEAGNNAWSQLGPICNPDNFELWFKSTHDIEEVLFNETREKYAPYASDPNKTFIPLALSEEQSRIVVDVEVPMEQYANQATAEFVTGVKDIDANWDAYVKGIEDLGLAKYLKAYQEVMDAAK